MTTHYFQDLIAWQKAMELVEVSYKVAGLLPNEEKYALADQIRRSSVSIPSNIAEGQKRNTRGETIQFTGIALGSLAELETQLILCNRLYKIDVADAIKMCTDVGRLSTALIKSLRPKS